jgi:hypothetical protein
MPDPEPITLTLKSGALTERLRSKPRYQEYSARFVTAGRIKYADQSLSKTSITAEALQEAAAKGLFNEKAVFIDHANWFTGPELAKLAGTTLEAEYDQDETAIVGKIRLNETESGQLAQVIIDDVLTNDSAPDIGISIVFWPRYEDPNDSSMITGIRYVESVDLVFSPAAEGRILEALSTLNQPISEIINTQHVGASLVDAQGAMTPKETPTMTKKTINTVEKPSASPKELPQEVLAEQHSWLDAARQSAIRQMINSADLPPMAKARLHGMSFDSPDAVTVAIQAESEYLAGLAENNVIQIGNEPPRQPEITGMRTSLDRIKVALEAMLEGKSPGGDVAPLTGIREFYNIMSGDYELTGMFQGDRVYLANVTSSTMANLVADALNKRVMNEFIQYPKWWLPIVLEEDFASLQQVKWISLGGVGELPTVSEGAAYTELTWDDSQETSDFVKKGGYLGITLETIDKDDIGRVRSAPRALAQAAWLTLSKAVSNIFTASSGVGPTMSDSKALFHADHSNLSTTALSLTQWNAIRTAMRKQTEIHSGERLGVLAAPKYLLVPPDLEKTALQILGSELEYTYALANGTAAPVNPNIEGNEVMSRLASARERVIVVDLWTDTNNYACAADPRLYPTIGLAYRYGRSPEVFSVASPTAGLMFTNDTMPVKVRYFYAVGPIDYRGLYKGNVA